jgi:hypothetical protein
MRLVLGLIVVLCFANDLRAEVPLVAVTDSTVAQLLCDWGGDLWDVKTQAIPTPAVDAEPDWISTARSLQKARLVVCSGQDSCHLTQLWKERLAGQGVTVVELRANLRCPVPLRDRAAIGQVQSAVAEALPSLSVELERRAEELNRIRHPARPDLAKGAVPRLGDPTSPSTRAR